MFKALLLAQWYGLSDEALEETLNDRLSFRRFAGFELDEDTPDHTTFCRFRNDLAAAGLTAKLFEDGPTGNSIGGIGVAAGNVDRCYAG